MGPFRKLLITASIPSLLAALSCDDRTENGGYHQPTPRVYKIDKGTQYDLLPGEVKQELLDFMSGINPGHSYDPNAENKYHEARSHLQDIRNGNDAKKDDALRLLTEAINMGYVEHLRMDGQSMEADMVFETVAMIIANNNKLRNIKNRSERYALMNLTKGLTFLLADQCLDGFDFPHYKSMTEFEYNYRDFMQENSEANSVDEKDL